MTETTTENTATEVTETKVCRGCAEALPITEFRLRRRNGNDRMNLCRICHNDRERHRRHRKERELSRSVAKNYVRKLLRREGNPDDLVASSVRQLGSGKKLAQAVADYLEVAPPRIRVGYGMFVLDYLCKREQREKRQRQNR
ncbi:MAG: hypothetical protein WD049_01565 [Candidatus Paceibacterota bacterium]